MSPRRLLPFVLFAIVSARAEPITRLGQPAELAVRAAGEHGARLPLRPLSDKEDPPRNPALVEAANPEPLLRVQRLDVPATVEVGGMKVEVCPGPLRVTVSDASGAVIQKLVFNDDGSVDFRLDGQPVLGL